MPQDYLDFDLFIDPDPDDDDLFIVTASALGVSKSDYFKFRYGDIQLETRLDKLELLLSKGTRALSFGPAPHVPERERPVRELGIGMFEALLPGELRALYRQAHSHAHQEELSGVRVRLRINTPQWNTLPWEFMYDPDSECYLGVKRNTPIIRFPEIRNPPPPLKVKGKLRILAMIANPDDEKLYKLDVEREKERLTRALEPIETGIEIGWIKGTVEALEDALNSGKRWHVFHFIGHGGFEDHQGGALALENQQGKMREYRAEHLKNRLTGHPSMRFAFLNCCMGATSGKSDVFSSTAATLVRGGLAGVLAMQFEISDKGAIRIAERFYQGLAAGQRLESVVTAAREHVSELESFEWGTPVLYLASPNGVLFEVEQPHSAVDNDPTLPDKPKRDPAVRVPRVVWIMAAVALIAAALIGIVPGILNRNDQQAAVQTMEAQTRAAVVPTPFNPQLAASLTIGAIIASWTDTPTPTTMPSPTFTPSDTPDFPATVDTENTRYWQNASATSAMVITSYTRTLTSTFTPSNTVTFTATPTPSDTPNSPATVDTENTRYWQNASATTAMVIASYSLTPTSSNTPVPPTPTLVPPTNTTVSPTVPPTATEVPPSPTAIAAAATLIPSGTSNTVWTPQTQDFGGVTMVLVPAGCFKMGSDNGQSDEKPVHEVCFDQPFWIDQTEVTQAQFKGFGGKAAYASYFTGDNLPVEQISWFGARDFCIQRGVRLPTEAEWEYAARGPEGLVYPWGNTFVDNKLVYSGNSSQTANVGSRPGGASWVGALDMSGNVWEWVSNLYQPYPYKANDGRESTSDTNSTRVLRGGGFDLLSVAILRAAFRFRLTPGSWYWDRGFRCARSYN